MLTNLLSIDLPRSVYLPTSIIINQPLIYIYYYNKTKKYPSKSEGGNSILTSHCMLR